MVGLGVLYTEYLVAAIALVVYLITYLVAGRGEWYRSVFGVGQVLLCVIALAWYSKVFFAPIHNMSTSSAVFYGLFAALFWTMAAGGLWIVTGGPARRRGRHRAREQETAR